MPGRISRTPPQWRLSPDSSILSTTFIASWRGQLLICTVCLALGIVYYYVRRPVSAILRSRREAVSRAMQAELMSQEGDGKEADQSESATADKRELGSLGKSKDKRKDLKKRKGSLLKVNVPGQSISGASSATDISTAGPSSRDSSPAPARLAVPTPTPKGKSRSNSGSRRDRSVSPSSPSPSPSPKPQIRIRHPTADNIDRLPTILSSGESPVTPNSKHGFDVMPDSAAWEEDKPEGGNHGERRDETEDPTRIPLPTSPYIEREAGPSRRPQPASSNGDISDSTTYSSSALSAAPPTSTGQGKSKSRQPPAWQADGFSIVPDASYLPPSTVASVMHKRKKKKDRQNNLPDIFDVNPTHSSDNLSRYSQPTSVDNDSIAAPYSPPSPHRPSYRGHARKTSLKMIRPPANATQAELEEYCNERDQVIDSLRAEVGAAKAQEAKAQEAEQRAKDAEARIRKDLEQAKKRAAGNAEEQNRIILETLKAYEDLYTKTAGMREAAAQWAEVRKAREGSNATDTQVPPMPSYHPHIIEMIGRQGPIANGVWVNPIPAPQPGQPPMTPNHDHRPGMPMSASFQSPGPLQNGFHPPHSPYPVSPGPRSNGFLSPAHAPPPPFMGHPFIGPPAVGTPQFAPPLTPQAMYTPNQHPGLFHHPNSGLGPDQLYPHNNGYRRVSDGSSFAGPLTPGIPSSVPSPHLAHIGLGLPAPASPHPNGHVMQSGSSGESMSAERRVSIEATVMRKKAAAANGGSVATEAPSITEEDADENDEINHGLGLGEVADGSAGLPSASASSFDPTSSPDFGGATSISRTSSKSSHSSPDLTHGKDDDTPLEVNSNADLLSTQARTDPLDANSNDLDVHSDNGTNGNDARQAKSTNDTHESYVPYFPTLAYSREENERHQSGPQAETA